jgi:hypothetical protein
MVALLAVADGAPMVADIKAQGKKVVGGKAMSEPVRHAPKKTCRPGRNRINDGCPSPAATTHQACLPRARAFELSARFLLTLVWFWLSQLRLQHFRWRILATESRPASAYSAHRQKQHTYMGQLATACPVKHACNPRHVFPSAMNIICAHAPFTHSCPGIATGRRARRFLSRNAPGMGVPLGSLQCVKSLEHWPWRVEGASFLSLPVLSSGSSHILAVAAIHHSLFRLHHAGRRYARNTRDARISFTNLNNDIRPTDI